MLGEAYEVPTSIDDCGPVQGIYSNRVLPDDPAAEAAYSNLKPRATVGYREGAASSAGAYEYESISPNQPTSSDTTDGTYEYERAPHTAGVGKGAYEYESVLQHSSTMSSTPQEINCSIEPLSSSIIGAESITDEAFC